ncbi:MAG: lytic transglycosylase domain-containing protein [Anaerohalosphaeraceae bacterium]|nr:lytic transglycosylase domain-containing protein [Anaerohalosphaeraceae bacterium]
MAIVFFVLSAFCFDDAGRHYNIPPGLLKAISLVESNMQPDAVNHNKNGSVDYGHMQINSYWKKHLQERWRYLGDPCYCTMVGAWILRQCIDRYGFNPDAVVCYHTGKSLSELSHTKTSKAIAYLNKIDQFLEKAQALQ